VKQDPIDSERIAEMLKWQPRRYKLSTEWNDAIHPPRNAGDDPSMVLPFCETFKNAFQQMCSVDTIGLRESSHGRCYTFLKVDFDSKEMDEVRDWLNNVGEFVAIRDCLTVSFALDYERENGNPEMPQTKVALLRARAKPYDRDPTSDTVKAANALAKLCAEAIDTLTCYQVADAVVAMPPSSPTKKFDLPTHLAAAFAKRVGVEDLSHAVRTVKPRQQLKNASARKKLDIISGTVAVDDDLDGRTVILLDDLYQSGTSMNYVAMELLDAGAEAVLGLCCEKTCRNDDNVSRDS
jgi:hypothetical protein